MRPRSSTFLRLALPATVFVMGFAVLVIEIVGSRMLSPYFGVSLFVWSSLITITLISLAAGYWLGGRWAEMRPDPSWLFIIVLFAATSLIAVPLVRSAVLGALGILGLRLGSFASAACLFTVPLLLLGAITPAAVKIGTTADTRVAALTGRLYAVSTLGSVAGALTAAFLLIPHLAIDRIFFLQASVLASISAAFWITERKWIAAIVAIIVAALSFVFMFQTSPLPRTDRMTMIFRQDSPYSDVRIIESASARSLLVNGIVQGSMDRSGMPSDRYIYLVDSLIRAYRPDAQNVLVIGLGTGALPKLQLAHQVKTDVVEIDPVVCSAARTFFGYRENNGALILEDGRHYFRRTQQTYDAVFIDAYAAEALPVHLFSLESFRSAARILRPGGIALINFHDFRDAKRDRATQSLFFTLSAAFPHVRAFEAEPWPDPALRNIVFLAANRELPALQGPIPSLEQIPAAPARGVLLTDDSNALDYIYNPVSEAMRVTTRAAFPRELLL